MPHGESAQVRKKCTMKKTASYGRIKETTIGGIFLCREDTDICKIMKKK